MDAGSVNLYLLGQRPGQRRKESAATVRKKEEKPTKSLHLGIDFKEADQVIVDIWGYLIENDRMASVAEWPTATSEMKYATYGSHAIHDIIKKYDENDIPNEGTVLWY